MNIWKGEAGGHVAPLRDAPRSGLGLIKIDGRRGRFFSYIRMKEQM